MNPFVQNQNNNQGNGPNFNQPPGSNNNTGNNLMNTLKQNNPNVPGNNLNVSHPLDEFSSLNNMNQEQNFQNSTVSKDTIKNYNPFDKNQNQNNDQQNNDNFQMSNIDKMKIQMDNSMLGQNPQAQQNISNNNQNVQNNTQNQNFQQNSFQNDNNPMNNNPLNSNNSNNINSQNSQNAFNNNDLQNNMNNNPNSGNNNALNYPDLDNLDPKNIIANKNKEQNNANSNNNQNQISNIGNNQMNNMSNMDMNNQMNNMSNMNMNNQMNNMSNNQMGNMNMNNQINNMGNNNPGMQMNNMENKNQINNSMNNTDNNNQMNNNMNNNNFGVQMSNMNNMSNNNAGIQMSNMNNNNDPMNSNMSNNNAGIQMSNMNNNNIPMNSNMNNNNAGIQMSNMNNNNAGIQMNSNMNNNNFGMQMSNTNNNNNQMNVNEQKYSFSRYQKAAKTGLKNLGDTSYLNAILQLLGSVRNLSSYFVNPKNKIEFNAKSNSIPLTFVIHRLFTHLYPYPEKPIPENYDPQVLWEVLGRYNQVYKSTKRRNPKDLINYLLLNLHRELNPFQTKITTKCDNTNKDQVIKNGMNDFGKSNNTIISNNFYWFEIKSKHCFNCKTSFYDFNNYEILELDIVAANKKYNNAPFTLTDCLNCQNQKIKNLFCEKCQNYQQFQINKNIFSSPVYFIFSLDRGNLDQNLLNIQFKLEEKIDLIQYLDNKGAFSKYQLSGVVSVYLNKNKYVCFGKSPVDKQWYIYDDNIVSNTNINEVINYNSNYGYVPCILLYSYMK